ncbi:MAG: phage tail tape measure protein [Prevotellaceae bacterium]|jgi:TP901 family phage tail tape measure protein|nr:phage tail tape measure protein [Prevotellaceae bacterium]
MDGYRYEILISSNGQAILAPLARDAGKADKALLGLSKRGKQASFWLRGLDDSAQRASVGLGGIGRMVASLGAALSAGALVKGIVGIGSEFEAAMSRVQAAAEAGESEMLTLRNIARSTGLQGLGYDAVAAGEAMEYLAKAGYTTQQITSSLPGVLNMAAAGQLSLGEAADYTINILSQFGKSAAEAARLSDQLALTDMRATTNIREIAEAMKYWGPTAAAMNVTLEESNAIIGILANSGLKGSMATRALSTSLVGLTKPTTDAAKTMTQLGLNFFDSKGEFIGVANMIGVLEQRLAGLNQKERQAALAAVFNKESIQELNILMRAGSGEIRTWTAAMDGAQGSAERMAQTKMDNLAGDWRNLKAQASDTAIGIYEAMSPTLRNLTQDATGFIQSLDTTAIGATLSNLAKGLANVGVFLMRNYGTIITLAKGYVALKAAVLGYRAGTLLALRATSLLAGAGTIKAVIGLAKSVHSVKDAMLLLNMATKANPIGLIVGGIAAVASAVMLFSRRKKDSTEATLKANRADSQYLQTLAEEKSRITLLSEELKRAETPYERRKEIIEELRNIQPSLVEGITAESDSYEQLAKNVEAYNTAKIREIALESKRDTLIEMQRKAASALLGYEEAERKYEQYTSDIYKKYPALSPTTDLRTVNDEYDYYDFPKNTETIYSTFAKLERERQSALNDYQSSKKMAEKFAQSINDFANKFGISLNNKGSGTNVINPIIPGGDTTSDSIVKGGTSQRIINITVHKFQDTVNNIFGSNNAEVRRQADEFMDYMNEGLLRLLNSANQVA